MTRSRAWPAPSVELGHCWHARWQSLQKPMSVQGTPAGPQGSVGFDWATAKPGHDVLHTPGWTEGTSTSYKFRREEKDAPEVDSDSEVDCCVLARGGNPLELVGWGGTGGGSAGSADHTGGLRFVLGTSPPPPLPIQLSEKGVSDATGRRGDDSSGRHSGGRRGTAPRSSAARGWPFPELMSVSLM